MIKSLILGAVQGLCEFLPVSSSGHLAIFQIFMGFDDNMLGQLHRPALTTVHQDVKAKGVTAADTLLKQLAGKKTPNQIKLPTRLVIRDTVKNINK